MPLRQQVEELRGILVSYLLFGDRNAVTDANVFEAVERVLDVTSKVLFNGPAGIPARGLEAAAALFLVRSRELYCGHDHSIAEEALFCDNDVHDLILWEAHACLVQRSWNRLAYDSGSDLLAPECRWEISLLERITAALSEAEALDISDTAASYCIAQLRWRRFLLMSDDARDAELTASLAGFEELYQPGHSVVPALVREYLECVSAGTSEQPIRGGVIDARHRIGSDSGLTRRGAARDVVVCRANVASGRYLDAEAGLGAALMLRGQATGRFADVAEAAALAARLWESERESPGDQRTTVACLFMQALVIIAASTEDYSRLAAAFDVGVIASQGLDATSWQTWPLIAAMCIVLAEQARCTGDATKIRQAMDLVDQVAAATRDSHERGAYRPDDNGDLFVESLFLMASLCKDYYDLTGDPESLRVAAQCANVAADQGNQSGPQWRRYALSAANIIFAQYEASKSRVDLDNAITIIRAILWNQGPAKEDIGMVGERRRLAELLIVRFEQTGYARDQSEAMELFIGLAREVGSDPDYPRRAALLSAAANSVSASASTPGAGTGGSRLGPEGARNNPGRLGGRGVRSLCSRPGSPPTVAPPRRSLASR